MAGATNIREATRSDLPSIRTLLRKNHIELGQPGERHVLVFAGETGSIDAVAVVLIDGDRGHLSSLTIADRAAGSGIEDRMIAVAEAVCSAFGATSLDVPASLGSAA